MIEAVVAAAIVTVLIGGARLAVDAVIRRDEAAWQASQQPPAPAPARDRWPTPPIWVPAAPAGMTFAGNSWRIAPPGATSPLGGDR